MAWNNHTDVFTFKVKPELRLLQKPTLLSKRNILSQVARIYDPIGFASAFLIRAKIGLQELWEKDIDWDEKLPPEIQEKWTSLFQEIIILLRVIMPSIVYGISVWGGLTNKEGFKALEALHCRAARIIFELPWEISNADVMKKANWSSLAFMYKISLAKLMYKIYNNLTPDASVSYY